MSIRGFEPVIGLEIHAQLKTKSKIFSTDPTTFEAGDNENTSPVSVGMPGTLPVTNAAAIECSIKAGLALNCEIRKRSVFARKNYFYPDLPKGYQISQYDQPICERGQVTFKVDGTVKTVKIERAHMEEDAGKSTHLGDMTLVNYNRSGVPLLEIVSGPDMRSPAEAAEYARTVRQILRYLNVCDGNLEEGSLRCDCNVSVRPVGQEKLGTKVEIKNINSFRFVEKAIEYEIERQIDAVERGEKIIQETRLWDPDKNRTFSMRTKEDAQDYRYFPDPDLLPVVVSSAMIEKCRGELPELPFARIERFTTALGLPPQDAEVLTTEREVADYFEIVARVCGNAKAASNWIMTELLRELNQANKTISDSPIKAEALGQMIALVEKGTISGKIGKTVFAEMWASGKDPETVVKEKGLVQVSDTGALTKIIDEVIAANPAQVADYRGGKVKLFGYFVGAVMKASKGQANPDVVNQILTEKLKG
ncbi:MAG: Asp-tRNA(Asn)/Glu-tRNA(Gln) amidotransferase subunit GatB [Bdellovibrionaceae bacterium]|nr:Asp-tRNA(Asn)/Glu-tRNA(Gln) amidotransferase subunit GatB [Pseudobdellovibrionaceae bacterium]